MSLSEKLAAIRAGAEKRIPAESRAVMGQATEALRASGILDRVIKKGDRLPDFELSNARGEVVRSSDLLATGAVVLTVFRGSW